MLDYGIRIVDGLEDLRNLREFLLSQDLGHFLLRQIEEKDRGSFDRIILDIREGQRELLYLLRFCGYWEVFKGLFIAQIALI